MPTCPSTHFDYDVQLFHIEGDIFHRITVLGKMTRNFIIRFITRYEYETNLYINNE